MPGFCHAPSGTRRSTPSCCESVLALDVEVERAAIDWGTADLDEIHEAVRRIPFRDTVETDRCLENVRGERHPIEPAAVTVEEGHLVLDFS